YQMGRFGSRDDAMMLLNQGVAQYETIVREGANQDTVRDLAASELRRGQIALLRGDTSAATADSLRPRDRTERLARRDPESRILLSEMCGFDFEQGRALTLSGNAALGRTLSKRSQQCFLDLHLEADTGPGAGLLNSWIAEAELQLHNLPEA